MSLNVMAKDPLHCFGWSGNKNCPIIIFPAYKRQERCKGCALSRRKEKSREYDKRYWLKTKNNPTKKKKQYELVKRWTELHPNYQREYHREYQKYLKKRYKADPAYREYVKEYQKKYYKNHGRTKNNSIREDVR